MSNRKVIFWIQILGHVHGVCRSIRQAAIIVVINSNPINIVIAGIIRNKVSIYTPLNRRCWECIDCPHPRNIGYTFLAKNIYNSTLGIYEGCFR